MPITLPQSMPLPKAVTPPPPKAPSRAHCSMLRLAAVGVVLLLIGSIVPVSASAETTDEAAQQAVREIQDARERANAAARDFFQAQSDLELLEDDARQLSLDAALLQQKVDRLRRNVEAVAVARFVTSGSNGIPLLTDLQAPKDQVQAQVLADLATNTGKGSLDEFDSAQKELVRNRAELTQRRAEVEEQKELFEKLQEAAEEEVLRLREIEEQRLTDVAVQRALAAQQAAAFSKLEEDAIRNAEFARRVQLNPGVAAAEAAAAAGDGDDAVSVDQAVPNSGASGGSSGGRTGTGGIGSSPGAILTESGYLDSIVCPMAGSAYGDSWGAPRSGGRRHEGVDMLAPMGIPVIAVVSGIVTFKQNRLGGNAVSLAGDNGNRYYYAHLNSYEGSSRRVEQGEIVGYNGDTGNATGVPHLHFEIHPGGGLAVNPTPSVSAAGC